MKLSATAEQYSDTLCHNKSRLLYEQAQNDLRGQEFKSFDDFAQLDFSLQIRIAADIAKIRMESYVAAYEMEGLRIEHEDLIEFITRAKELIRRQANQTQSMGLGAITMVRNNWSDSYRAQMLEHFENKAFYMLEPTINELNLKVKEAELRFAQRANMKRQRELLTWIFEKTGGRQYRSVDLRNFLDDHTDWNLADLEKASDYFDGEGLIEQKDDSGLLIWITHEGIKAFEQDDDASKMDPRHSLIQHVQHVNIHAPGASVVQGSGNVLNVQQNTGATTEEIVGLLQGLRNHLMAEKQQEAEDYIEGIEAEIKSDEPSNSRLKLFLNGLSETVKDAGKEILVELGKKLLTG